ncbi:RNA 2'-phosphotransferase [Mucilaginibacter myungsuensis]|uniref:Probable RNA 2'-phosphotransferase n=1 Tax=Mucilaginibacter myungsuensis TaxID=649104 RepID=A0A929KWI5_9SPHI|nr:RNA 2'-phosphotransferase [Mucilaginibacter myungsuensis]MBE9661223.1 RNA 2'-phosphotransferase [Mucilaginibacter myungsuensis]MDN3597367.1 RNA 2'-phosphotransferase [Mucilaginibacter myungsuensis]
MITEKQNKGISKFMSYVLRHRPEVIGLQLDENGWADVAELITKANANATEWSTPITIDIVKHIVDTNDKKRFAFNEDGTKIRASQGHSVEVDLAYESQTPPEVLYHGTATKFLDAILIGRLTKQSRQHVHMSENIETMLEVAKRHGKPVLLKIHAAEMAAAGYQFYLSANNVWLTDSVPAGFLTVAR